MKLSITKLTTAVAVVALLALPVSAAQTPPSQPPATAQPPASSGSQQPATTPQNAADQTPSITEARQHLAKAKAALDEVNASTLDARVKSQLTEMNRRVSALERSVAENAAENASARWGTEIGEIDKLLTNLVGEDATTGATSPTPTGTSGKAAAAELDDATRSKLLEVRTHLTAFATAMVGGQVKTPTPSTDPTTDPNATPPPTTSQPTGTSGTTPQQPTGTTGQTQPPAQTGQPDEQAARQHLTTARNTLSEITQLPAAAQLTGETRNHVSQLISNFNELISAKSEWRGSYAKVSANLTALLGPYLDTPDPSGAPGTAVGTSGTPAAGLDPEIREKLMQFRRQLAEFEKAVGGTAASVQSPSTADTAPGATPPEVTRPTDPTTPPATTPPPTTPPATTPPATTPPATTPPSGTEPTMPTTQGTAGAQAAGNAEIMRHIAAIEAMFKAEDDSGGVTLTKLQLEQLRAHLANLRQAIEKR